MTIDERDFVDRSGPIFAIAYGLPTLVHSMRGLEKQSENESGIASQVCAVVLRHIAGLLHFVSMV